MPDGTMKTTTTENGNGANLDIATIPKNSREVISVKIRTFKGKRFIDTRIFFPTETGDYAPSGKGFGCSPEVAEQVIAALQQAVSKW